VGFHNSIWVGILFSIIPLSLAVYSGAKIVLFFTRASRTKETISKSA
jgi:hypothetical protein